MSSLLKPWLLLAVIFVLGVVTGAALTIGLGPRFMHAPGAQQMKRLWMEHLTKRLNLTADQQAKIQPILADADTKIHALHRDEVDRFSQIFKETDDQISALLTPAQQAELQKMESEREKMFGHMHHHGVPGDEGGMPPPPAPPPPPGSMNAPPPGPPPAKP
jgi:Spy/CpxP family protein refolding chaperone